MKLSDMLTIEQTFNNLISKSQKRVLEQSAHLLYGNLPKKSTSEGGGDKKSTNDKSKKEKSDEMLQQKTPKSAASPSCVEEKLIFNTLIEREQLGTTAIGKGVAIPHCSLDNLDKAYALFLKLNDAIDFNAPDDKPVDLIFVLMVPNRECQKFKKLLKHLLTVFDDDAVLEILRNSECSETLFDALIRFVDIEIDEEEGGSDTCVIEKETCQLNAENA